MASQTAEYYLRAKRETLHLLTQQSSIAYIAIFFSALFYTAFSWRLANKPVLIGWLVALGAVTLSRYAFQRFCSKKIQQMNRLDIKRNLRLNLIGIVLSGTIWGFIGLLYIVPSASLVHLTFTVLILTGLCSAAVAAYSVSLMATYGYVIPILVPLSTRLLLDSNPEIEFVGGLAILYMFCMILISNNIHRKTIRAIELGAENEDLTDRLHSANHEIRTPLSAIIGFAELLTDTNDPVKRQEYTHIIHRNGLYLKKLVDDLFRFSINDSSEPQQELISISQAIEQAISTISESLQKKNLTLRLDILPEVPASVYSHPIKFQQILINLLSNAVKFTPKGSISVTVDFKTPDRLIVLVSDTGIGITQGKEKKLFSPFYREDREEVQKEKGSGLGLALSKNIARKLGGDLELVSSTIGEGSTFRLEIEAIAPPSAYPTIDKKKRKAKIINIPKIETNSLSQSDHVGK